MLLDTVFNTQVNQNKYFFWLISYLMISNRKVPGEGFTFLKQKDSSKQPEGVACVEFHPTIKTIIVLKLKIKVFVDALSKLFTYYDE